jgi:hypothetical protein
MCRASSGSLCLSSTPGPLARASERSGKYTPSDRSCALTVGSKMTDVYEGSLIRVFRRLEEALRQMAEASKVMGSEDLQQKFEEALTKVRRDIVAAQSLYL